MSVKFQYVEQLKKSKHVGEQIIKHICGFSDMIDGTIARKTNIVSEFGPKLGGINNERCTCAFFTRKSYRL